MMAAPIDLKGSSPVIGTPRRLFATRAGISPAGYPYDVMPDGSRFLIANQPEQAGATVTVVMNWTAALPVR